MRTRNALYCVALGIGILAVSATSCGRDSGERTKPAPEAQTAEIVREKYTVKSGDYLSRIVYKELGIRGNREIYDRVRDIQQRNNLGSERDISEVIDGKLVPGKDGLVDLIYPGEKLILY